MDQHLLVLLAVKIAILRVIGEVVFIGAHLLVEVLCSDVVAQGVCVSEQQLSPVSILLLDYIVVELIHPVFAQVQDAHASIDGLVEHQRFLLLLDCGQVISEEAMRECLCCVDTAISVR